VQSPRRLSVHVVSESVEPRSKSWHLLKKGLIGSCTRQPCHALQEPVWPLGRGLTYVLFPTACPKWSIAPFASVSSQSCTCLCVQLSVYFAVSPCACLFALPHVYPHVHMYACQCVHMSLCMPGVTVTVLLWRRRVAASRSIYESSSWIWTIQSRFCPPASRA
jgi:hypothetical protein